MAAAKSRRDVEPSAPDGEEELSAVSIASKALDVLSGLTTKPLNGVTSVEPIEDGWLVEIEVLEERRIPSSSDMLALYEVELGFDGTLLAYRRTRRYGRGAR
ncbi:MAG TPA: gas vesicle protein GvpO [Amycolatopsis sp.]|uniref:gas vesicle protein GvpO n=1 Tax=Amycolatopsis sp. TaxID=37632 RepID=UPI002B49A3AC|nr:gas vesicle protein GvpO [Amycolatopsis sp.]HKS49756.1 gas vesicle protein GvpO [Amycolatopsis sp.]